VQAEPRRLSQDCLFPGARNGRSILFLRHPLARFDCHVERTRQAARECVCLFPFPLREQLVYACSKPFDAFLELDAGTPQQL